nr:immunoglobulin heavy chain junction region [Macaca mulatta]MOV50462.1 immunoglobulin heavy chain junction region [Macaca mulatta]MOV50588.1 immunoglobulin heavy chain junction region [Macaca mulatta]MOV50616.1 immunoglobulin heavy chain junction region [Macaca mulatta]MOV51038.1 immunoglobulin heavy chain junction region [Macaca mulatta]
CTRDHDGNSPPPTYSRFDVW